MAESLCRSPETTTLLIDYTPIQNAFCIFTFKWEYIKLRSPAQHHVSCQLCVTVQDESLDGKQEITNKGCFC